MGRPEAAEGRCRRHPWHRQSPGVCSACLCERLSQISCDAVAAAPSSSSSEGSSSCSSALSSPYSPMETGDRFVVRLMRRSRTVAVVAERPERRKKSKKGGGFWSKVLRVARRRKEVELHSKTVKEGRVAAWVSAHA